MTSPFRTLPDAVDEARSLDRVAEPLGKAIGDLLRPGALKDLLSGTWLGHPVHPMLTDVVIGSWTSAAVLDAVGGERSHHASDLLVGAGILAAIPTAASGASDWSDTWGKTRRVGLVHGLGNTAALAAYVGSYVARRRGARGVGVALGFVGYAIASVTAYLGGHLTFGRGVGVDAAVFEHPPKGWTAVARDADLQEGRPVRAHAGDTEVVLIRHDGVVRALAERCTHRGGPLHEGTFEGGTLGCPWHGSVFAVVDGSVVRGPATAPQPSYETRVRDGNVEVRLARSGR